MIKIYENNFQSLTWWPMLTILALGSLRQEGFHSFKADLSYTRLCLKGVGRGEEGRRKEDSVLINHSNLLYM